MIIAATKLLFDKIGTGESKNNKLQYLGPLSFCFVLKTGAHLKKYEADFTIHYLLYYPLLYFINAKIIV